MLILVNKEISSNGNAKLTFIADIADFNNLQISNCYDTVSANIPLIHKIPYIPKDNTIPVPDSFKIIKEKEIKKEYDPIDSLEL